MKVHWTPRRAAAARTAAVVAGVVLAVVAALETGLLTFDRGGSGVSADPRQGPTASTQSVPSIPVLSVELARDDAVAAALAKPPQGFQVVVQVSVRGFVPQLTRNGSNAVGADNLRGFELRWGDETVQGRVDEGTCLAAAPLVEVDLEFVVEHVYGRPGEYTVTYRTAACEPVGTIARTLSLTVG